MKRIYASILILLLSFTAFAQDPLRFAEEVKKFENTANNYPEANRIVFTGSSSIRLWVDFKSYFPNDNVINTGFGGSETSDLIHYKSLLIDQFNPRQVFIYEGDNDLNSGKSPIQIVSDLTALVSSLLENKIIESIVIISPKPSIARAALRTEYEKMNKVIKASTELSTRVQFADIWPPMLNPDGSLKKELFIEDGLHMNKKGYDLWIQVIAPLVLKSK
ncbi:MAG: G-D-S-L family lipolytic protein [Cytophagales bacterium CG12_big_fil_rev_8_21_14_0_65_40_12]|nr:MAG: G-D-S-L family lipolytic protein [Cytophagales bacterium CG12_big_fil_rev_8_21_14_0_65_40_12]PIW03814.1 MAG: G-D-S-L family lipolytic protein [Cytophagales bacterium CG17_big_fil_post_rev_8_21_14_2_50_40_13]